MASINEALVDITSSHQIGLHRLSIDVVNKIVRLLDETEADLVAQLQKYDPASAASRYKRARLDRLLADVRALNRDVYKREATYEIAQKRPAEHARDEAAVGGGDQKRAAIGTSRSDGFWTTFGKAIIRSVVPAATRMLEQAIKDSVKRPTLGGIKSDGGASNVISATMGIFNLPTQEQLVAAVSEPFTGPLFSEWVDGLEAARFDRLRSAIRMSVVDGVGVADLVKRIRGTKALNYKDGILQISRRSAEALATTALSRIATQAHRLSYEENADILEGRRFVATLDPNTCMTCAALDGQVFPIGEGNEFNPPLHRNCRCTTVPVVKGGGAAGRVTYNQWLKQQPPEVQDQALGPTRGQLYREGKLPLNRFVDALNRPLTLDQLRQIEPEAFAKAGLTSSKG